jgi:uncharacterized protein YndB with AHSA1/START domain
VAEEHAALRFTRRYSASLDEVWRALTEPDSISRWLGPPDDVEARSRSMRTVESGRVLELDWTRRGESDSLVRFELAPDGAGTVLVVDHSRLDARVCMGYLSFWAPRLDRFGEAVGGERR